MRFNIERFQQSELVVLGLDTKDMIILMYIIDFYNSSRMFKKQVNYKDFFWVNYQTVLDELPILGITDRRVLARKFEKFVKCELMEKLVVKGEDIYIHDGQEKKRKSSGTYTYFHLNPKALERLLGGSEPKSVEDKEFSNIQGGVNSKVQRVVTEKYRGSELKSTPKDSYTIDSNTKDIYTCLDHWNKKNTLPKHKLKTCGRKLSKQHEEVIKDYGIDIVIKAIENYAEIVFSEKYYFSYIWNFWDFIIRGVDDFVDESKPFVKYKNKKMLKNKIKKSIYPEL